VRADWPGESVSRIPNWLYTDPEVYAREQARIFGGRSWCYVGLGVEVPGPGDFKRSFVGERPVILVRDDAGALRVLENRCAHRGLQLCLRPHGRVRELVCPYHQWTYDLTGRLVGVPFRRGVKGQGGMPPEFQLEAHALGSLAVAERHGVVFASFDAGTEPLADYLGPASASRCTARSSSRSGPGASGASTFTAATQSRVWP
jgi:phenylpropionate dioxygenase-like ring-hydroxylating dioxygenase large terminal subunit